MHIWIKGSLKKESHALVLFAPCPVNNALWHRFVLQPFEAIAIKLWLMLPKFCLLLCSGIEGWMRSSL